MIRVKKAISEPSALQTSYNHPDVCKQLLKDQHDKCYICEQHVVTGYQVDHLQSQHHYPDLRQEWSNLFIACSYCNGKKSDKYDTVLHPSNHNIEEIIVHQNDFPAKKVLFLFLKKVDGYTSGNPAYEEAIEEELKVESELLGFKYHIIINNRKLNKGFGHLIAWNKMYSNE
jgi:uncharacterized protein (TIGR02646 family)